ncbi:hypothetical protein ACRAWG_15205 [Methylobacterium sp. P31]
MVEVLVRPMQWMSSIGGDAVLVILGVSIDVSEGECVAFTGHLDRAKVLL